MAQELPPTEEIDARTIQTGFVKFWDDTGGPYEGHFNFQDGGYPWAPSHYEFFRPDTAPDDGDITVGRADTRKYVDGKLTGGKARDVRKNTFRMIPKGTPRGEEGSKYADDYAKKLLFTWAVDLDPYGMADLFGTTLRKYEKPKVTRSGKGQLQTKRRGATPMSLDKQQTKFLWARLIHDNAEVVANKDTYSNLYLADTDNSYRISMNRASNRAMRDLFKQLGDLLEIGIGGGKSLGADSPEEIMVAIAGENLSKLGWNEEDVTEEQMIRDMDKIIRGMDRDRRGKIDIPPHLEEEIKHITDLLKGEGQAKLIERIKEGGIEITEQHGRVAKMYGSNDEIGDGQKFIEFYSDKIKEDIVKQYTKSTRKVTGKRTVAEQFFDRRIGFEDTNVLTWSEPAWGGIAFFGVYIPSKRPLNKEDIGVISYFLNGIPTIWQGILRQKGIHENHSKIARAVKNVFSGVIKIKGGDAIIKTKTLGTLYGKVPGLTGPQISTKVDAVAPQKVAKGLYDLVKAAAIKIGDQLTLDTGGAFSEWVKDQHERGEETAWKVHQRKGKGWVKWLRKTGGKDEPRPKDAIDWTQPVHPRPFLWMTAVGQAAGSQEVHKELERGAGGRFKKR